MPISDENALFHDSGPQGVLDYLHSRLEAGDLSPEEALAMLSAVHQQLVQGQIADPRIYQSYTHFMESLHSEMPDIHDYVVSAWNQRNASDWGKDESWNVNVADTHGEEVQSKNSDAKAEGFEEIRDREVEASGEGEPGEPVEMEDGEGESEERSRGEESGEGIEEEPEVGEQEERVEEKEETEAETRDELEVEPKTAEAEAEEIPEGTGEVESEGEKEAESLDQQEQVEEVKESESEAEGGEPESSAGGEETEWPAAEAPEPEEPLEEFEDDEGETPAVD